MFNRKTWGFAHRQAVRHFGLSLFAIKTDIGGWFLLLLQDAFALLLANEFFIAIGCCSAQAMAGGNEGSTEN